MICCTFPVVNTNLSSDTAYPAAITGVSKLISKDAILSAISDGKQYSLLDVNSTMAKSNLSKLVLGKILAAYF